MTVASSELNISSATGNGSADEFDYDFTITAEADLRVYTITTAGVKALLALTTDYTVADVGVAGGGSITLVAGALASGTVIYLEDNVARSQDTSYGTAASFLGTAHEVSLDLLTRLVRRLLYRVGSFVKANITTAAVVQAQHGALTILTVVNGATGQYTITLAAAITDADEVAIVHVTPITKGYSATASWSSDTVLVVEIDNDGTDANSGFMVSVEELA
jgi:hypothetical protein